jgi:hypothetical protein
VDGGDRQSRKAKAVTPTRSKSYVQWGAPPNRVGAGPAKKNLRDGKESRPQTSPGHRGSAL